MLRNESDFQLPSRRRALMTFVIFTMIVGLVATAGAFQRKPLFEDFTSTTCPPCAALAPTQEAALVRMEGQVVVVAYHMNWPAPGNDPWCADNPVDNLNPGRRAYYGVNGVPTILIDGTPTNSRTEQGIVNDLTNRARVNSPLQIELSGRIVNGNLQVNVGIEAESAVNGARLYISLNEIYYRYDAYAEWWDHYDAMLKMVPDYSGTVINVSPGQPFIDEFEVSMNGVGWHELDLDNLKLIAWVQEANHNVLQSEEYQMGIDSPAIDFVEWNISDAFGGDGDGRPEPGEAADFTFQMQNDEGYLPAESVDVQLTTADEQVVISDADFHLDALENGAYGDNYDAPFTFTVSEDFVAHPVTFVMTLVAQPGNFMIEQEVTVMIDWPAFLFVDASSNANVGTTYRSIFGNDPMPWCDVWNRQADGPIVDDLLLGNYEVVLWEGYTNNAEVISEYEADVLTGYLDAGGTLVMSSAFLAGQLPDHRLITQYLGATVDQADVNGANWVLGTEGDAQFGGAELFLGGAGGFQPPTTLMSFQIDAEAQAVASYADRDGNLAGVAAIKHEAGTYRTLFFGFPVVTVQGAAETDRLSSFMGRIWEWVQNEPQSAPDDEVIPARFALESAYPNPFNAQSLIRFGIPVSGNATVKLFDVAGREVASLFDGVATAGSHITSLNAVELGLESGVYYVRLEAGTETKSMKVVYLK